MLYVGKTMGRKTIKAAREYYNSIELYEDRKKLMDEFDELSDKEIKTNREEAFYRWIRDNKL